MGSGIEERIRELLATRIGCEAGVDLRRVELSGVTLVELHVERLVVVVNEEHTEKV